MEFKSNGGLNDARNNVKTNTNMAYKYSNDCMARGSGCKVL